MNCSRAQDLIYHFDELTSTEEAALRQHVATCKHCRELLDEVQSAQATVRNLLNGIPPINNPAQMTQRVMNALPPMKSGSRSLTDWLDLLTSPALKWSLLSLSLFLLFFFAIESGQRTNVLAQNHLPYRTQAKEQTVALNLTTFYTRLSQSAGKQVYSLYGCLKKCYKNIGADCAACKMNQPSKDINS